MMTIADLLPLLYQNAVPMSLGGPAPAMLPKAQSNATGGQIPGVKPPPMSSPAEWMNAGTAANAANYENKVRELNAATLKQKLSMTEAFRPYLEDVMKNGGIGGESQPGSASPVSIPGITDQPSSGRSAPQGAGIGDSDAPAVNLTGNPDLHQAARDAAAKYGVPEEMFLHQINGESNFNPAANNKVGLGHDGIAQFDPPTAKQYGVDTKNPYSSLDGAARYMADLYKKTGGWDSAMRSYLGATTPGGLQRVLATNPSYARAYALAQRGGDSGGGQGGPVQIAQNGPLAPGSLAPQGGGGLVNEMTNPGLAQEIAAAPAAGAPISLDTPQRNAPNAPPMAPMPLGGATPQQPPPAPQSGAAPSLAPGGGLNMDTLRSMLSQDPRFSPAQRKMLAMGVYSRLAGMGDAFAPFEQAWQNSPEMAGKKALQEALAKRFGGEFDPQVKGALASAEQGAKQPFELEKAREQAELDRRSKQLEQERAAGNEPYTFTMKMPDGNLQEVQTTKKAFGDLMAAGGQRPGAPGAPAPQSPIQPPQQAAPIGAAAASPAAGLPLPGVSGKPVYSYPPDQEAQMRERGLGVEKRLQGYRDSADAAFKLKPQLQTIAGEIGNVVNGPFADWAQTGATYLRLFDPRFDKQVSSYENWVSTANEMVRNAVKASDPNPTLVQTKMAMDSMPLPPKSEAGLRAMTSRMMAVQDHEIARAKAIQLYESSPDNKGPGGFDTWWRDKASPYAFVMANMDQSERLPIIANLRKTAQGQRELAKLQEQAKFIHENGLAQ